jgi:triacylglycerol lipase
MDKKRLNSVKTSFFAKAVKYQPVNAYWLGQCATYAYKNAAAIKSKVMDEWGFDKYHFIQRADTQCFIASTDKIVVLSFRGTEVSKYKDLLSDADLSLVNGYGGKVHKGFKQAYHKVRRQIDNKFKAHNAAAKTVWITGHSLGGALAVLAAYDLKKKGYKVNGVYTMGQPRVGNSGYANAFEKCLRNRCFRFVEKNDKVPEMPLKEFGCVHAGQAIYIASRNRLTLHYRRSKNVINALVSMGKAPSAHSSDKYAAAIAKNIGHNPFTSDARAIKEKPVIKLSKTASKVDKTAEKLAKGAAKSVGKEANKAGKTANKVWRKAKKLF